MFLLRSAFWLTLAFMVMRPGMDVDMGESAANLSREVMVRGNQFVAEQIEAIECTEIQCLGGKAFAAAALQATPLAVGPMHSQSAKVPVPFPRPRPDRAG